MYLCEDVKDHWYHDLDDISCQVITFLDKNKTQNNIGNESIYIFYFISEKERKENEALNGSKEQTRQQWNVHCGLWSFLKSS